MSFHNWYVDEDSDLGKMQLRSALGSQQWWDSVQWYQRHTKPPCWMLVTVSEASRFLKTHKGKLGTQAKLPPPLNVSSSSTCSAFIDFPFLPLRSLTTSWSPGTWLCKIAPRSTCNSLEGWLETWFSEWNPLSWVLEKEPERVPSTLRKGTGSKFHPRHTHPVLLSNGDTEPLQSPLVPLPSPLWWPWATAEGPLHPACLHAWPCWKHELYPVLYPKSIRLPLPSAWLLLLPGTRLPRSLALLLFPMCTEKTQHTLAPT